MIEKCVSCGVGVEFTDLPAGSATKKWFGKEDVLMTKCDHCGCWFPQDSVAPSVRKDGA